LKTKDVGGQFGEPQRRERRQRGGLEDDGTTGGKCGRELPDRHHERIVPRCHLPDHARRLATNHAGVRADVLTSGLALHHPSGAGEEAHVVDGEFDVEVGHAFRFSDVLLLKTRQRFSVAFDRIGELVERGGSFGRRRLRPGREGRARCGDRSVDVGDVALRNLGNLLLGGGIDDRCGLAAAGIGPIAIDEHLATGGGHGHGSLSDLRGSVAMAKDRRTDPG